MANQIKMVPFDQVDAAKSSGFANAVKMTGPNGELKWVPEYQVNDARKAKFAVVPQGGVQRMATPDGKIMYALPKEVDKLKASGHVPIDNSGNFRVDPIMGEDNVDTMKRAATIAKNLPPEVVQKAIEAEKKTITPAKVVGTLAAAPVIGAVGGAGLARGAELLGGAGEGASALYDLAVKHLAGNVLPGMEEAAAKAKLIQYAPRVLSFAKDVGIGAGGLGLLWKAVFSNDNSK